MIYQQEIKETNDFYLKYKDKKIVYSKQLSQDIGQVQKDTRIKIGSEMVPGVLISSTMENLVLMVKLNDTLKQTIYDENGSLTVFLKFIVKETRKDLIFTIPAKFLNLNDHGLEQKDLHFISLQIRRKISNDLIRIFGSYHEKHMKKLISKKKKIECLLLSNNTKNECITENINSSELMLLMEKKNTISPNDKVIAILTIVNTGEVIEIIGTVLKRIDETDGQCHLLLGFSTSDQSPRFSYSIHVLKNLINS